MIIYGTFTETSVPKLFMAGVIPGLIMTALFMLYIGVHALIVPAVAPREAGRAQRCARCCARWPTSLPFVVLIAGTLGGLYFGVVTTTEGRGRSAASCRSCSASMFGELTLQRLIEAMHTTVNFTGNILFLIFAAYVFSYAISFAGIGEKVTEFIVGLQLTQAASSIWCCSCSSPCSAA